MSVVQAAATVTQKPSVARKRLPDFVRVNEHQDCIYLWPLMLIPLLLNPAMAWGLIDAKTAAWFALSVIALSLTAATVKLERMMAIVFALILVILAISTVAAEGYKIPVLTMVGGALRSVAPQYEPYFGGWLGGIGLFFFLLSQGFAFFEGRWKLGRNGFENIKVGRGGGVKARAGRNVSYEFGDPLKRVLGFGAGDIIVSVGDRVEFTMRNVFFLSRKSEVVDQILASLSTVRADEDFVAAETHHS